MEEYLSNEERNELYDALNGRHDFYDLLAALFFKPISEDELDRLAGVDFSAYEDINEHFSKGINDIRRYLKHCDSGTRQELAVDFTGCFAGVSSWNGRYAVPYESVFTSEEGLMYQESFHEVIARYRENGVKRVEGFDYPDDHLSLMFEYLSIISSRMADAVARRDDAAALSYARESASFIEEHIVTWYDSFRELALCLVKTRFYRGFLEIAQGFVDFDLELLADICNALSGEAEADGTVAR